MSSEWVDFKQVKAAVSIEAVLNRYGVQLRRVNQSSLRGTCPLPSHTSKGSPSFCVNVEKSAWACQSDSCMKARGGKRGGNALDFVSIMENCSVRDAAIKIANWFNVATHSRGSPALTTKQSSGSEQLVAKEKRGAGATDITRAREHEENKPLGFALKNIDHSHPYLTARGIAKEIAEKCGVGFFSGKGSMSGRIIIPIHNRKGELVAYAGRSIDESEPKYKFPSGFLKSHELWNFHRVADEKIVVVVEGFFDCMKVTEANWPCVALMGSSISNEQEKLLVRKFSQIVLMLDGDDAGRNATEEIVSRLVRKIFVRVVELPDGKEPDMLNLEELHSLLQNCSR